MVSLFEGGVVGYESLYLPVVPIKLLTCFGVFVYENFPDQFLICPRQEYNLINVAL